MCVKACISRCTCQILTISERNVLSIRTLVALSQTEINDVDGIFGLIVASNQKVIWFNITMNDALFVYALDSLDHLYSDVQACLQIEFASTFLEQSF